MNQRGVLFSDWEWLKLDGLLRTLAVFDSPTSYIAVGKVRFVFRVALGVKLEDLISGLGAGDHG